MAATAAKGRSAPAEAERPAGPGLGLGRADLAAEPGAGDRARWVASPRLDLGEGIVAHVYLLSIRFHLPVAMTRAAASTVGARARMLDRKRPRSSPERTSP